MTVLSGSIDREFRFERRHFEVLRELARSTVGIELNDSKTELIYGRLSRRLRTLGIGSFDEYCEIVVAPNSAERSHFVNAITTNFTSFFREPHHFEYLRDTALPVLTEQRRKDKRIRIWCSASSTGQEPYSIAITAAEYFADDPSWDWRVLATDIDTNALARAEAGIYRDDEVGGLDDATRRRWFQPIGDSRVQAAQTLRDRIYFRTLNLIEPWPMSGPVDVIFCRNVVIYFSKETQKSLFERFAGLLAPDGYLFVGHSETIMYASNRFEPVGQTVYRKAWGQA